MAQQNFKMAAPNGLRNVTQKIWSNSFVGQCFCTNTNGVGNNVLLLQLPKQTVFAGQFQKRYLNIGFPFIAQQRKTENQAGKICIGFGENNSHPLSRKINNALHLSRRQFKTDSDQNNKETNTGTSGDDIPSWVSFKYIGSIYAILQLCSNFKIKNNVSEATGIKPNYLLFTDCETEQ